MIDWAEEWRKRRQRDFWLRQLKEKEYSMEELYNRRPVELMEAHYRYVDYPGPLFEQIRPFIQPDTTVLDIGAGDGAFTIPSARIAKKVTAVELSQGQITRLLEKAEKENLSNIEIINKRWEEIRDEELAKHDIVIAAYCFSMPDIRMAIQKMLNHTKRVLFLITAAESGLTEVYQQVFDNYNTSIDDYIYFYNLLHQMGMHANVQIITRSFSHPWDLMIKILRVGYELPHGIEERILEQLKKNGQLIEENGILWVKSWHKDALIWYPVDKR